MSVNFKIIGAALCLTAACVAAKPAEAQSRPAATTPAAAGALQPAGANEVFARWDKDHSNTLSREEFKAGWDQVQANLLVSKLHENFVAMDTNKDGALQATEYAHLELVKKAGASAPPMSTFDANKSQTLDFKEYLAFLKTMLKDKR